MTTPAATSPATRAPLPHWETVPDDVPAAIVEVKRALRDRIAASGRSVAEVFAEVEARIRAEVAEITATRARGEQVWPVLDYADIEAGTVAPELVEKLRRRGCAVVRGHFPREQAEAWDRESRRLRGAQPVLRELRRPGRRLLRQRDVQAGDLPDLLVAPRRCRPASTRGWPRCSPS